MSGPILSVVTLAGGAPDRASLEALTLARSVATELGSPLEVVVAADPGEARAAVSSLAGRGVTTAVVVEHDRLTADHPDGWAAAVAGIAEARGAAAVVGPGTERGNDLLARVAVRLDVPLAANCLTVATGERYRLTRQRWAGSLIEECWLDARVAVLSVAPNTIPIPAADATAAPSVTALPVTLTDADLAGSKLVPQQFRSFHW